ncbi:hypothetical protein M426DRAFT_25556 [Hypoxylon sp. CI-4A]|nr:hypothetical protein M426DRAFT_25556 [Hypoxylon sp. CI-4A]
MPYLEKLEEQRKRLQRLQLQQPQQQQQQSQNQQHKTLQGVGAQFDNANVDYAGMSSAMKNLLYVRQPPSGTLKTALARTNAADKAREALLKSDVVASLTSSRK